MLKYLMNNHDLSVTHHISRGGSMKILSLILWVTQFGLSILFPLCVFLYLGFWLQTRFSLGIWVMAVCGIIGFMTSISTAKACIQSLLKAAEEAVPTRERPIAFNDHK